MSSLISLILSLFSFLVFGIFAPEVSNYKMGTVILDERVEVSVDLAESPIQITKGLGGRESMREDEGMLFLFAKKHIPQFWMKDMQFEIDILWINDFTIVDITENIEVDYPARALYSPSSPVNKVLEVNNGFVERHNIKIGDKFKLIEK